MTARNGSLPLVIGLIWSLSQYVLPCFAGSIDPDNSIHGGATSVQFMVFGSGSRAPAFRTSGIFVKSHFSDRGALRAGFEFYLDEASGEFRSPDQTRNTSNYRNYSYALSAEIQEYLDATGSVTAYLGLGSYWLRGRNYADVTEIDPLVPYTFYSWNERKNWEVGGTASAGFEWFFKRKLSMIGRVGASFGFGKTVQTQYRADTGPGAPPSYRDRRDTSTAGAGTSTASLGLGVYF